MKFLKSYSFKNNSIISIGNLSVGGSGKTPMVIALSKILDNLSVSHAVVSRGYKKKSFGEVVVSDGLNVVKDHRVSGDEPLLLASTLKGVPVVVGDKARAINIVNKLKKYKTILIDDGYQTFKIKRDLNILLLDLSKEITDYRLFPVGCLREPLSSISRADIVLFTKGDGPLSKKLKSYLMKYINLNTQLVLDTQMIYSLLEFKNNSFSKIDKIIERRVISFSGIASPQPFIKISKKMFVNIVDNFTFSDHCIYNKRTISKIKSSIKKNNAHGIVTTMKDFIKIKPYFSGFSIFVVDVEYDIINVELLEKMLKKFKN